MITPHTSTPNTHIHTPKRVLNMKNVPHPSARRVPGFPGARWMLAGIAALAAGACAGEPEHGATPALEPVSVTVTESWTSNADDAHPARVVSLQEADVSTRMAGTVSRIPVEVGDRVGPGALLASLDEQDVRARIDNARAQVELARRTFQRISALEADGAASANEKDQAQARLTSAEAMLQEARAQAAYVEIRAPFAGVVTARMADAGDLASPGQPLVRLAGNGVKVVAELAAGRVGSLKAGDAVRVEAQARDGRAVEVPGTVSRVVPALDRASHRFQVEVVPSGEVELIPGAFARIHVAGAAGATRWIPRDAVVRSGQLTGVYTVESDTLRLRWLRLGRTAGDAVEVLAGPAGTLQVVRDADMDLRDGQPVSGVQRRAPSSATPVAAQTTEG